MNRAFYLISYDIPDDKRRLKIAHLLEGYGERVQYSVFEVWVTEKELEKLRQQLERWVKISEREKTAATADDSAVPPNGGSVRIYGLCRNCQGQRVVLGAGQPSDAPGLRVI